MRIASLTGATTVQHDGHTFTAGTDGMFDVPEHVGATLTGFPHWAAEHVALAARAAEQEIHNREPDVMAARIAELEQIVAELTAKRGPGRPRKSE